MSYCMQINCNSKQTFWAEMAAN